LVKENRPITPKDFTAEEVKAELKHLRSKIEIGKLIDFNTLLVLLEEPHLQVSKEKTKQNKCPNTFTMRNGQKKILKFNYNEFASSSRFTMESFQFLLKSYFKFSKKQRIEKNLS
jgi:hypothetical protein